MRYPLVELFTTLVFLWIALHSGPSPQWFMALVIAALLIAGSGIDIDHHILPDQITLSILWIGLLCSLHHVFIDSHQAIIGAFWGYMCLWLFVHGYYLLSGKFGMGHGDFKLLAAMGAFVGWTKLPVIIILSSSLGAIYGVYLLASKRTQAGKPIPFGPFLAGAGFLCLLYGDFIIDFYWQKIVLG